MKVKMTEPAADIDEPDFNRGDCTRSECPGRRVLAHVTGRWGSLVLYTLQEHEPLRFSELRKRIEGVSEKMLSQTLRGLERDGLLLRVSRPVVPPHVEYSLTANGRQIAERVHGLGRFIETHISDFVDAQAKYDAEIAAQSQR